MISSLKACKPSGHISKEESGFSLNYSCKTVTEELTKLKLNQPLDKTDVTTNYYKYSLEFMKALLQNTNFQRSILFRNSHIEDNCLGWLAASSIPLV